MCQGFPYQMKFSQQLLSHYMVNYHPLEISSDRDGDFILIPLSKHLSEQDRSKPSATDFASLVTSSSLSIRGGALTI